VENISGHILEPTKPGCWSGCAVVYHSPTRSSGHRYSKPDKL